MEGCEIPNASMRRLISGCFDNSCTNCFLSISCLAMLYLNLPRSLVFLKIVLTEMLLRNGVLLLQVHIQLNFGCLSFALCTWLKLGIGENIYC